MPVKVYDLPILREAADVRLGLWPDSLIVRDAKRTREMDAKKAKGMRPESVLSAGGKSDNGLFSQRPTNRDSAGVKMTEDVLAAINRGAALLA